jgi:hypothetical protein
MVKQIGLPGIYIGTLAQGLISTLVKPRIVYKNVFKRSVKEYYTDSVKYLVIILIPLIILELIKLYLLPEITILNFIILVILVTIIPNGIILLACRKREEFIYILNLVKQKMKAGK